MSEERAMIVATIMVENEYTEWLVSCADKCSCCPACHDPPCEGCCQGGVCDAFSCRCDEQWDEPADEDPEALDWDDPEMDFSP